MLSSKTQVKRFGDEEWCFDGENVILSAQQFKFRIPPTPCHEAETLSLTKSNPGICLFGDFYFLPW